MTRFNTRRVSKQKRKNDKTYAFRTNTAANIKDTHAWAECHLSGKVMLVASKRGGE